MNSWDHYGKLIAYFVTGFVMLFIAMLVLVSDNTSYDADNGPVMAKWIHYSYKTLTNVTRVCSQRERRQHIRKVCNGRKLKGKRSVRFLVDDEHRIAYCGIPKIASSTWNVILMTSTKDGRRMRIPIGAHHPDPIRARGLRYSYLTPRLKQYTKFMIVRNPIDRFQSAYYDKMARHFTKKTPHRQFLMWARNTVLRATGKKPKGWSPVVSFKNFVSFVLKKLGPKRLNEDKHWARYASKCNPCGIRYDYILRTETMTRDAMFILPILHRNITALQTSSNNVIAAKHQIETHKNISFIGEKYLDIYNQISVKQKNMLKRRYARESFLFGYYFDPQTNTASCGIRTNNNSVCC